MKNIIVVGVVGFTIYYVYSHRNIKKEVEQAIDEKKTISPEIKTETEKGETKTTESAIAPTTPSTTENVEKNETVHVVQPTKTTSYFDSSFFDALTEMLDSGKRIFFSEKSGDERLSDFIYENFGDEQEKSNEITKDNFDSVFSFLSQQDNIDFIDDMWTD